VALTVGLYYVKTRAQTARKHAVKIEHQIAQEEASLRVLRAEIAYLENPERLKDLSGAHLGLQPIAVKDVFELKDIVVQFPLREPSEGEGGGQ
jgi:hypothetical protein